MSTLARRLLLGCLLGLGVGCDSAESSTDTLHERSLGDEGIYEFELTGESLEEGLNDLTIQVYRDGVPVSDATVIARTVMPAMGHPTSEVSVDADAAGQYEASVVFSMPGLWDVEIEIGGEASDSVVFRVEVD